MTEQTNNGMYRREFLKFGAVGTAYTLTSELSVLSSTESRQSEEFLTPRITRIIAPVGNTFEEVHINVTDFLEASSPDVQHFFRESLRALTQHGINNNIDVTDYELLIPGKIDGTTIVPTATPDSNSQIPVVYFSYNGGGLLCTPEQTSVIKTFESLNIDLLHSAGIEDQDVSDPQLIDIYTNWFIFPQSDGKLVMVDSKPEHKDLELGPIAYGIPIEGKVEWQPILEVAKDVTLVPSESGEEFAAKEAAWYIRLNDEVHVPDHNFTLRVSNVVNKDPKVQEYIYPFKEDFKSIFLPNFLNEYPERLEGKTVEIIALDSTDTFLRQLVNEAPEKGGGGLSGLLIPPFVVQDTSNGRIVWGALSNIETEGPYIRLRIYYDTSVLGENNTQLGREQIVTAVILTGIISAELGQNVNNITDQRIGKTITPKYDTLMGGKPISEPHVTEQPVSS